MSGVSESIEAAVRALERDVEAAVAARARCVAAFQQETDPDVAYLMAERLHRLGPSILPDLLALLADPQSSRDLRYLAAWVALALGDRGPSVEVLVGEVEADGPWTVPAANALARAGVSRAGEAVVRALERADVADVTAVLDLLDEAKALDAALPPELRERLHGGLPAWASDKALARWPLVLAEEETTFPAHDSAAGAERPSTEGQR